MRDQRRDGASKLIVGVLAVLWMILVLGGPRYRGYRCWAVPDGESVLFAGVGELVAPEEPRGNQHAKRLEQRVQRQSMAALRDAMSIPQQIPVPRDIPMYKESGTQLVFPEHGYENTYVRAGMNASTSLETHPEIHGEIMTSSFHSFNNDWESGAGLVDGFHDCQRRITFLADIYNLDLIRKVAKELHREIPDGVAWVRAMPAEPGLQLMDNPSDSTYEASAVK